MKKRGMLIFLAVALLLVQTTYSLGLIGRNADSNDVYYAEKIAALEKPAVVKIETTVTTSAKIPDITTANGEIIETSLVKDRAETYSFSGSGLIITPDGYIITNAHVVQTDDYDKEHFIQGLMLKLRIQPELKGIATEYLKKFDVQAKISKIEVLLPISSPTGFNQMRIPAEIKKTGSIYPGKDIAILKISKDNLPTITSLKKETPFVGANVIAIGYPGIANIGLAPNEATVTAGIISAYKTSPEGWKLIQIDAPLNEGNSGGPLFDSKGQMLGIITWGKKETQGFNWAIPTELIYEYLNELNIKPSRSMLDKMYEKALSYYWKGKYTQALLEFRHVLEIMPFHPLAPEFIYKSNIIITENQEQVQPIKIILLLILFLATSFLICWQLTGKRKHK